MPLPTLTSEELRYQLANQDDNRQGSMIVGTSILLGFSVIAVALRLISRSIQRLRFAFYDYAIVFSLVNTASPNLTEDRPDEILQSLALAMCAVAFYSTHPDICMGFTE